MYIRLATSSEFDEIYMMGYDVWSYGASVEEYLETCRTSKKYKLGQWYVFADDSNLFSALILYSKGFSIPEGYYGIGSIVTNPKYRKKGYASKIVNEVCVFLEKKQIKGVYLYSDINAVFYQNLGFITLFTDKEICMLRSFNSQEPFPKNIPSYF